LFAFFVAAKNAITRHSGKGSGSPDQATISEEYQDHQGLMLVTSYEDVLARQYVLLQTGLLTFS
jgi:hypothetical protein